jgi:hypothetical protein|tara:strand:- start:2076 stop:2261 length:186 start_codon:yes stop_codon:yes gene_type:complete
VRNLWEKDRKTIFKELYRQYLEEGYSKKESKKFASLETEEVMSTNEDFIKNIFQQQEEEEC